MGAVTPIRGRWLDPSVIRAILGAWEAYMVSAGMPASTITLRLYHLMRFTREVQGGDPLAAHTDVILAWLGSKTWSPNTRRSYRSSLRAFYRWAVDAGHLETSPAEALPPVRVPRGVPRPASEDAYRAGLRAADPRVRLAVQLAGACGLRRGEIAASAREHVELDPAGGWCLRVAGKGGHVRLVPLPAGLAAEILARPPGWLFPSSHQGGTVHLTPHHLGKLVAAALPGDLTTHTLRHRAGTVAYAATRDLRAVQELLGHAKPETTALYTRVPTETMRAAVDAAAEVAPPAAEPPKPERPLSPSALLLGMVDPGRHGAA